MCHRIIRCLSNELSAFGFCPGRSEHAVSLKTLHKIVSSALSIAALTAAIKDDDELYFNVAIVRISWFSLFAWKQHFSSFARVTAIMRGGYELTKSHNPLLWLVIAIVDIAATAFHIGSYLSFSKKEKSHGCN